MSDFVLVDGDIANFIPTFGAAVVVVQPGQITGSGHGTLNGKLICIDGDETTVEVPGCMYITPIYSIPGSGTLKIASLGSDQRATMTHSSGAPVLLKGSLFDAKFEVQSPAKQPTTGGPVPDATPEYAGKGSFITNNTLFKGT